jgi:PIN domain nuclease of toxin-antitoxin system
MRLLLDTVAFIWAVTSADRISNRAMAALRSEATIREISVVSLSEVAIKQSIGKLRIGKDEVLTGIADLRLRVLPYTADHALHLFDLPLHHSDPFDRQIIAQALCENIPVVTSDEKFNLYKGLKILW